VNRKVDDVAKVLEFKTKAQLDEKIEFDARMVRIKESLAKINKLMRDFKDVNTKALSMVEATIPQKES
jgi:hypothetical protein